MKSIFLFFLIGLLTNQINCNYYGYQSDPVAFDTEQKVLDLLATDLLKSELDEKSINQPTFEQKLIQVEEDLNWKLSDDVKSKIGDIAGIAIDENENILYIFHRAKRSWTMDLDLSKITEPIREDTVLMVNATDGTSLYSWGSNFFYLPHGISLDRFGNVWLTDVVTHQVYRFKKGYFKQPELVLGEKFVAGGKQHFCMPTDTVVASNYVYISDGYCNSRVAIYSLNGLYLDQIAYQEGMIIPHSLTLLEDEDLICVADREGRAINCYSAGLTQQKAGRLVFSIKHPSIKRLFAIGSIDDLIFGINGPELTTESDGRTNKDKQVGFVVNLATERLLTTFYPKDGFQSPHDLTINRKTNSLFISDLKSPHKIFKFFIKKN